MRVSDDTDPSPEVGLVSVTSSEPDDAPGRDGTTANDVQGADLGTDDRKLRLRSERAGDGPGRVYTLTYRATDHVGNSLIAKSLS